MDELFESIEAGMTAGFSKYGPVTDKVLSRMKCKRCGGKIGYDCEGWGGDYVTLAGLSCKECHKTYGITGYRIYRLDGNEITGISWVISFIVNLILE